jgi:hypothetical protein
MPFVACAARTAAVLQTHGGLLIIIKPKKLHITNKEAELVGHLAKVDKAVNVIYTLQNPIS